MAVKIGALFLTLLVSTLAVPTPESPPASLFEHVDPTARIVGGTPAAEGSASHMAALTNGAVFRSLFCGGSIIGSRTILTAAHCIAAVVNSWGVLSSSVQATVGTVRWSSGGQSYSISNHNMYSGYDSSQIKNDLGLLTTSAPIVYSATVAPITIAWDFVGAGVATRATGWGRTVTGGAGSPVLLELSQTTVDGQTCATQVATIGPALGFRPPAVNPSVEICTFHSAGHGMCQGDSGSALVRTDRNQQIGLVSWGIPCARGAPDMFVRLSAFQEYIQTNTI